MKSSIRKVAETVAPEMTQRLSEARWLRQHAREFKAGLLKEDSIEARVDFARSHTHLCSNQKRAEIIALLRELAVLKPVRLCEIGADKGGTLALFASVASPNAQILSLDIAYPGTRSAVYRTLAARGQKVTCMEANSHLSDTLESVKQWLNGELLDFLFIDGDHSYQGVKADYEMYSPLVRPGGIVAFHDIVPDFMTRFGEESLSDVGDVPRYWSELKSTVGEWKEFVEDPAQDGYGIGMIRVGES